MAKSEVRKTWLYVLAFAFIIGLIIVAFGDNISFSPSSKARQEKNYAQEKIFGSFESVRATDEKSVKIADSIPGMLLEGSRLKK